MKLLVRSIRLLAPVVLTGCISVKLDHVVRDTADVSKSTYQSLSAKWDAKRKAKTATVINHSYIGASTQSVVEVKQLCEAEAVQKLRTITGLENPAHTVIENEIMTSNGVIAANCKVGIDKVV